MGKLTVLALFCLQVTIAIAIQCNRRDYGHGSHVCVCSEALKCEDMNVAPSKHAGSLSSYSTSKAGARFELKAYNFSKEAHPAGPHNKVSVEVNRGKKYQKIIGFGGTFTDAAVIMISKLPKDLQTRLIRDYFSESGLDYNLCRVPIGATDASTHEYSLDDHPGDDTLSQFALQSEDTLRIQMAKEASKRTLKLFGSAWSPPAWMKTNNRLTHGGSLIGHPGEKYYKLFSKYLIRFLEEYKKLKAEMWGLTVLNEPLVCYNTNWVWSCLAMNGSSQRDFVKLDLGPDLKASEFKDIKLMSYDFNLPDIINYNTPILTDKDAAKYIDGIAFHWYASNDNNRPFLEVLHESFPDKFLLSTEACSGHPGKEKVLLGDWGIFNHYADDIIKVLNFYSTGWVDWSMVQDLLGGPNWVHNYVDSAVIVNETSHEYYKQPIFYALGHFSKFIVPDSVRVQHTEVASEHAEQVLVTVFERPDNGTVVTVLNKNTHPVTLQLHDPIRGNVQAVVAAESLESLIYY